MAFNIGDRVRVKDYEEIANHLKAKNTGDDPSEALELLKEDTVSYHFETDIAEDNVVIVIMYEDHEDSSKEICRGHGHIIHEGALGIAQATSYAMYRLYKRFEENNL